MSDSELQPFVNEWVELQLETGTRFTGRLVTKDDYPFLKTHYAIMTPSTAANQGPSFNQVLPAKVVSIKILDAPPEMLD